MKGGPHGRACLLACGGLLVGGALACGKPRPQAMPPPVVSVTEAIERDVPVYHEFVGTLEAYVKAEVRARVAGIIVGQNYREGAFVKAGALLFPIDPAPLRAARQQAEGQLEQARAALEKAEADIARYTPLVEKRAVAKEQLDNALASRNAAKGQVALAQGALQQADLNLGYTRVLAPVDGIADIAQVRVGNLVGQDSPTLLTTVSSIDPIRFVFQISEGTYLQFAEEIRQVTEHSAPSGDLHDGARGLDLVLTGERPYPYRGQFAFAASHVDPTTGTLTVEALFPNPDMLLRPGQYARARLTEKLENAVLIPDRAVTPLQNEEQVAIVGPDGKPELRSVKLGPVSGSFVVVEEGVKPRERVVVDGVQKVKAGQPVTVTPADTSQFQLSRASVQVENAPGARAGDAGAPPRIPDAGSGDASVR